ncbi:glycosyltransferase [Marinifilum sp. JC120]|nr:glycosyltransferase [Marinifilum sp. JC120]
MPTLGLVIKWGSSSWTGGPNYLKNIALANASVSPDQKLRLIYFVRPDQVEHMDQYRNILPLASDIRIYHPDSEMGDVDVLYPASDQFDVPAGVAPVYWIPDFQHCYLPEYFSKEELDWRSDFFSRLAGGKDLVVLSSEAALNDFHRFFTVTCPTFVVPFASSLEPGWMDGDHEEIKKKYSVNFQYLMCCNQFWKHKDHKTLFKALALLRDQGIILQLICTGATEDLRHPDYFDTVQDYLEEHNLTEQVHILGLLPRADQIQLLRGAQAVVQPSLFEGWSTVIEDCRLLGKKVIHSDIPVHLEQSPESSLVFKGGDAQNLADILVDFSDKFTAMPDIEAEKAAFQESLENCSRFGRNIGKMVNSAMKINEVVNPTNSPENKKLLPTKDIVGKNSYRVKGVQWYDPPLAGASTFADSLFEMETYTNTLDILNRLSEDDYLKYIRGFMSSGLRRFGKHWKYADICTVLYTLSNMLDVKNYLKIGVLQGRSMAMVISGNPQVDVVGFDMWRAGYAGMDNPGPAFVQEQMERLGHKGTLQFVNGNSHETLPHFFSQNPRMSFDLITVDSDHTPEGATQDLLDVLPHLRIGGAIVFDGIAHPSHPELLKIWQDTIMSRPEMSGFAFTELGYGVAFAIRMR